MKHNEQQIMTPFERLVAKMYCPGGTKRRNSNSNSLFLGSKTGIRFVTKWHHMAPNQLLTARISIQIPVRVFFSFKKKSDLGFLGQKRRIGDKLQVLKTRTMILLVCCHFSWLNNKNSKHIDAYNFSASPQPPQTIQTCYDNRKIGFST